MSEAPRRPGGYSGNDGAAGESDGVMRDRRKG
jgi:hypothetical protein